MYSNAVGDPDPLELPVAFWTWRPIRRPGRGSVPRPFSVVALFTLLDGDGRYRGALDDVAARAGDRAHQSRRADGSLANLADWQGDWGRLLARADILRVFSEDSRDQVAAAHPALAGAIHVTRHSLPITPARSQRRPAGRGVVAALGNIGEQKGAGVLRDLSGLMTTPGDPGLVLIGNIDPAFVLPEHVPVHGTYQVIDLPDLAQRYRITDWLVPSIWPETVFLYHA